MADSMNNDNGPHSLEVVGARILRYGLVLILLWIGSLKFTAYEAQGVHKLASSSPLLSWVYGLMSVQSFSMLLGVIEITLAALIATRPLWPQLSAIGSLGAIGMSLITLGILLTSPAVWQPGYGFPALSGNPGQFLLKDVLLLGTAVWTAGEALRAVERRRSPVAERTRATI